MEIEKVLAFLNETPHRFLHTDRGGVKCEIDGAKCKVVRNNLRGGIEVFYQDDTAHFNWDRTEEKWICPLSCQVG